MINLNGMEIFHRREIFHMIIFFAYVWAQDEIHFRNNIQSMQTELSAITQGIKVSSPWLYFWTSIFKYPQFVTFTQFFNKCVQKLSIQFSNIWKKAPLDKSQWSSYPWGVFQLQIHSKVNIVVDYNWSILLAACHKYQESTHLSNGGYTLKNLFCFATFLHIHRFCLWTVTWIGKLSQS